MYITTSLKAPNGVCAVNVIEELMQLNHSVTVFTQENGTSEIRCPCHIVYSKHCSIHVKMEKLKTKSKSNKVAKTVDSFYKIWNVLCYPIWPVNSPGFMHAFSREAYQTAKKIKADLVIAEYGDIACINAGKIIKQRDDRIKTVAYFIDALYCGAKPSFMSQRRKDKKSLHWENRLLKSYDKVIMMEATRNRYTKIKNELLYWNKMSFLDIPMVKPIYFGQNKGKGKKRDDIVFIYIGSMPKHIRNPKYLLELFKAANNVEWSLRIYGNNDYINQISEYKKYRIHYMGKVSHEEAIEILNDADFLINIGNGFPEMVPSKIFEYISMDKPIISTFCISDDPCMKYLSYYEKAICIDENEPTHENIRRINEFINNMGKLQKDNLGDLVAIEGPLYKNTPRAFVDCLEDKNDPTR